MTLLAREKIESTTVAPLGEVPQAVLGDDHGAVDRKILAGDGLGGRRDGDNRAAERDPDVSGYHWCARG